MVSDTDSFLTARRFTQEEGILVGGSTGTAVFAALSLASDLHRHDVVVVLIPDSGRGYLSRVYSDEWMADHGFLRTTGHTVSDVLERKSGTLTGLIHVHPSELARQAIAVMAEFGVSQLAVIQAEPPLSAAEVVGAVYERDLMQRAVADPGVLDAPIEQVMGPPLPTVGAGEPMDVAVKRLEDAPAVLVLDRGHPVGVITRSDALGFLAQAGVSRDLAR
jgi:cystathionine beta-synthase